MRTVKHRSLPLNVKKKAALVELCHAYAREKRYWLQSLQSWDLQAQLGRPRSIRDENVKQQYQSRYGLQARHWKLALEDAAETWNKYWQALFVEVRLKIAHHKNLSETQRHYAYWLLKGYPQFAAMMKKGQPEPPFPVENSPQVINYIRRIVKKLRKKQPSVKKARSVRFDANCYEVYTHNKRQYIKLMSLERGIRITLPLSGKAKISGTITLVISENSIDVHASQELKQRHPSTKTIEAVDFGYTEVMTDTQGLRYGTSFGTLLNQTSNHLHKKMQKRHKLHALEKEQRKSSPAKAAHLRKYNLGRKKHRSKMQQSKSSLEKEINTSINQLIQTKQPTILVTEDLRHPFTYDKSKQVNRKLSSWLRSTLQDRISFKALAKGFRHEQVNPAYGSQSCPSCEFVDQRNRNKDSFKCLHCGHEDISDRVAAQNYARRFGDPEIERYTPYRQVKTILLNRFHRRLETGQPVTVHGRTLDTATEMYPPSPFKTLNKCHSRERRTSLTGQSIRERNK